MSASPWHRRRRSATSFPGEKNLEKRQPLKTFSLVERNEPKALLNITLSEQRDF